MAIPAFVESTGLLPAGDYPATLAEIKERFCWNYRRTVIYNGLEFVASELTSHQVTTIWIDGSFVTTKDRPRDVDVACEVPDCCDPTHWGLCSPSRRKDLKRFWHVDLLHYWHGQPPIKEFLSKDRDGTDKGIIQLLVR